jgi:hypothetical protein
MRNRDRLPMLLSEYECSIFRLADLFPRQLPEYVASQKTFFLFAFCYYSSRTVYLT